MVAAFKFLTILIGVQLLTSIDSITQDISSEIVHIEKSLVRSILIEGKPIIKYDLMDRMKHHDVPGLSIAVVKDSELRWVKKYGVRDADSMKAFNDNTIVQAGSISKPITAIGILKLVEDGLIQLDHEVNQYLTNWKLPDSEYTRDQKITVRHLLTHTAGLNLHGFDGYDRDGDQPDAVQILSGQGMSDPIEIEAKPGQEWNYSGGGYVILQLLIEEVTGLSFSQYMNTQILPGLNMSQSTYQMPLDTEIYQNVSSGHDEDGQVIDGQWRNLMELGAGGLWTTTTDLANYCMTIQNLHSGADGLLSQSMIQKMLTKHSTREWGLGPWVPGEGDQLKFRHDGRNPGYVSDCIAYANRGDAVIIMTNADKGNRLISEILISISEYYGWDAHAPRIIQVPNLFIHDMQRYVGNYSWNERPNYHIAVRIENNQLIVDAPGFPIDYLTPFGVDQFIDLETSVEVIFRGEDNSIGGLKWRQFEFDKTNE